MRYPIIIRQTERNTVIAVCPVIRHFFAEGENLDDVLDKLKREFLCYLHDDNVQLEVISMSSRYDLRNIDYGKRI